MNNRGVTIAFALLAIWAASVVIATPEPVEEGKPAKKADMGIPISQPESLSVANDRPTVMIVADLSRGFGAKWISDDAVKLRAKGWEVMSVDVAGLPESRFYVWANGRWMIHSGDMSLTSLKYMLGR